MVGLVLKATQQGFDLKSVTKTSENKIQLTYVLLSKKKLDKFRNSNIIIASIFMRDPMSYRIVPNGKYPIIGNLWDFMSLLKKGGEI